MKGSSPCPPPPPTRTSGDNKSITNEKSLRQGHGAYHSRIENVVSLKLSCVKGSRSRWRRTTLLLPQQPLNELLPLSGMIVVVTGTATNPESSSIAMKRSKKSFYSGFTGGCAPPGCSN